MEHFLQQPASERLFIFQEFEAQNGLSAFSVEKDFWVCWTLRALFGMANIGEHVTFKGGTSLSKAWKLIERFSEDIDLVVDKKALGFDECSVFGAPSKTQRDDRLKELVAACREWVQGPLQTALAEQITAAIGEAGWKLVVDPSPKTSGQCLLFHYPSVFPANTAGYVRPVVKIELGARADDWPHEQMEIEPYLQRMFPSWSEFIPFSVRVLAMERTFWEKACLLHEETFRPENKTRNSGMSRHYYDLWCLLEAGVGARAMNDKTLFERVVEHRRVFFQFNWVDYSTHKPGTFRIVPPAEQMPEWSSDYRDMQENMFFGEAPAFESVLAVIKNFETAFNALEWT